jgi:hypothetical protein
MERSGKSNDATTRSSEAAWAGGGLAGPGERAHTLQCQASAVAYLVNRSVPDRERAALDLSA